MKLESYHDGHLTKLGDILKHRIKVNPLNLVVSVLFFLGVLHTFFAGKFTKLAKKIEKRHREEIIKQKNGDKYTGEVVEEVSFISELLHFLGEVEVIFGIWVIPVFWIIAINYGMENSIHYFTNANYTEPIFVVVIMTLASTRPIVRLAEKTIIMIAGLGGGTTAAVWFTVLTVGPILGSFITEPGAMTVSALILAKQFYSKKPGNKLAYATIGLLFVNISVGGTITHFAAPPVLMVAEKWHWDLAFMFTNFGYKALIGIACANLLYYIIFKSDLKKMGKWKNAEESNQKVEIDWDIRDDGVPVGVTIAHIFFMTWTVFFAHYPPLFLAGFLCYLGFAKATKHHQNRTDLKPALLVGFFLAGLVIHGGLQQWWIAPVLGSLSEVPLMLGATVLTAINDNAAITYLSSLVPDFNDSMKYAVVAGAVSGGGLTVIANAPNPAGQSILQKFFPDGVSPIWLLAGAFVPTIIMGLVFMLIG
ncbi:hypothetical protein SCALIN_C17_0059 [Candidatus Scalindua japonica]|uniref:Na+/H+ antiporter n=2 Tax=Candidatus Scalindua japonica TaxID=1284222 RepID=A0A286TYT2_9BACT|nr:hypothetical protein SCALIN_C17_0059 [Candidatus Scalindua japonica]